MHVKTMTNEHPDFYRLAGPFLSRREIVKELGGPIWDEDGKLWFFAMRKGKVAGFATMTVKGQINVFQEAYVLPEYRGQGIHADLIDARITHCQPGSTIETLIFNKSVDEYKARGFAVKREVGKQWTEMQKTLEGAYA